MRRTRYWVRRFNLIEIVLAMGVVGIGIAGVMSLMVPALNANKDAQNDMIAVEVASKIKALIELKSLTNAGSGWSNAMRDYGQSVSWDNDNFKLSTVAREANDLLTITSDEEDKLKKSADTDEANFGITQLGTDQTNYLALEEITDPNGNYFKPQAIVRIYRFSAPRVKTGSLETDVTTDDDSTIRYLIEVSWPVNIAYNSPSREFRYFPFEITNPKQD